MPASQNSINFTLPLDEPAVPTMPLARRLHAHFMQGGSILEAIDLVERAELAAITTTTEPHTANRRGTRLHVSWAPSPSETTFALGRGLTPALVQTEAEKFRNYWIAKAGANAVKRDWSATWRNWVISALERNHGAYGPVGTTYSSRRPSTRSDTILAAMGRVAQQLDQERGAAIDQGRQISDNANLASQRDAKR